MGSSVNLNKSALVLKSGLLIEVKSISHLLSGQLLILDIVLDLMS